MEDARDSDGLEVWGRELPAHGGGPPDGQSSVCDEESGPSIEPDTFASMFHPEGAADSADLRGWSPVYCPGAVPSARGYSTAVVHDRQHVFTFGGSAGSSRKNDVWTFRDNSWAHVETNGASPSPRNSHSAVVWRESILVFGGWDGCRNCNDLYVFNIPTSHWRHVAPRGASPKCRRGHSAVVAGGTDTESAAMYIFGGWDGGRNFSDFHKLCLGVCDDAVQPSPSRAHAPQAAMMGPAGDGDGGAAVSGPRAAQEMTNVDQLAWVQVPSGATNSLSPHPAPGQAPSGRRGHSCVNIDGALLFFGGQDGNNFYNDAYLFQIDGWAWASLTCSGVAPLPRSYHTAAVFANEMYVFGGTGSNWCFFNDLHLLHLHSKTWSSPDFTGAVPSPRCFHTAVVVGSRLVVFGGARLTRDSWEYFNHLYHFRLEAPAPSDGPDSEAATTLSTDLRNLLGCPDLADVTFLVEGREVHAHKALLCARCEYFRGMLQNGMAESKQKTITLPDIKHKVFERFLEYVYTDHVVAGPDIAVDLMSLASCYGVEGLKNKVEQRIIDNITLQNVSLMLVAADTHGAQRLKRVCIDYMLKEFGRVITSDAFILLCSQHPPLAKEVLAIAGKNLTFSFR